MSTQSEPAIEESLEAPPPDERDPIALDEVFAALELSEFSGSALVAECGAGHAVRRLLDEAGETRRVMAVDLHQSNLDLARRRVDEADARRVFFNTQGVRALSFAPDVFDLAVCFQSLVTTADVLNALSAFATLVRPGGSCAVVCAARGSFPGFREMLVEEALANGSDGAVSELDALSEMLADEDDVRMGVDRCGLELIAQGRVSAEIDFGDPADFAADPLVAALLPTWRSVTVGESGRDTLGDGAIRRLKTYFSGATFTDHYEAVWVVARVPEPEVMGIDEDDVVSVDD